MTAPFTRAQLEDLVHNSQFSYEEIGERFGLSKNAIAGHVKRMGIEPRRKAFAGRLADVKPCEERQPEPKSRSGAGCRWITGDVHKPGWHYCGEPTVGRERAWCAKHRKVVYHRRELSAEATRNISEAAKRTQARRWAAARHGEA